MVTDWIDTSTQTLVIEFYEFDKTNSAEDVVNHLNSLGDNELTVMINKGIHDYLIENEDIIVSRGLIT